MSGSGSGATDPARMDDLFDNASVFEPLPMIDADVRFWRGFYAADRAAGIMQELQADTPWRQETITLWGKQHLQPRLSAWYADPDTVYAYSGLKLVARAWTTTLTRIRREVEAAAAMRFNSVLLNLYRDGQDSMGWHSDDEAELGRNPAVASLSFGETRIFRFKHKSATGQKSVAIELSNGSLLLMAGPTQHCWQHSIAKQAAVSGPRINLTFRNVRQA